MSTYFKAVRPNGASFYDPDFRWLPEDLIVPEGGYLVEHPDKTSPMLSPADYLSVDTKAADCTGFRWPCRLLEVGAVGEVMSLASIGLPNKRVSKAFRVVRELDPTPTLGPNGKAVVAVVERAGRLTADEASGLQNFWEGHCGNAAWHASRNAAWNTSNIAARNASRDAAWNAAWIAARDAAWNAARDADSGAAWDARRLAADAAIAELAKDLISEKAYQILMGPWRSVITD